MNNRYKAVLTSVIPFALSALIVILFASCSIQPDTVSELQHQNEFEVHHLVVKNEYGVLLYEQEISNSKKAPTIKVDVSGDLAVVTVDGVDCDCYIDNY